MTIPISADCHLHTAFSGDCDAPMEDMVEAGIRQGLTTMCFTEHMDMDFPPGSGFDFELDTDAYYRGFLNCREKYKSRIRLLFGVELGLLPHLAQFHRDFLKKYPFDFVIGSSHAVHGQDPYYPPYYQGRTEQEAYLEYFHSITENIRAFSDFDSYGHIDYVVRYGPEKNKHYTYEAYREVLDEILGLLIEKGIGLECNTGGYKYGLGEPNPSEEILRRYRSLGGELLTIGSDAHDPAGIAHNFHQAKELLKCCGFKYYTVFSKRAGTQFLL